MRNLQRAAISLVPLLILFFANAETAKAEADWWDPEARAKMKSVDDLLALLVPEIRKNLPMKVDEITTWLTIQAAGPAVLYTYRIDLPKDQLNDGEQLKAVTTQNACANKTWKMLLDAGARQRHVYTDETGLIAIQFDIDRNSCR